MPIGDDLSRAFDVRDDQENGSVSEMHMKAGWRGFIGMVVFLLSFMAYARQRCEWRQQGPLGPAWYQPGGWGGCDNSSAQQTATSTVHWASRWGAIAISSSTGHVGTTANKNSKREAKRTALEQCGVNDGIPDCKISVVYDNGCAAYAWGGGMAGTGSAPTVEEASVLALNACNEKGQFCTVRYSECSPPVRIQ